MFVESTWLVAFAASAHHQVPAAVELLERARQGEFILHLPNVCIGEARQAILTKCQPRREGDALRRFLSWSEPAGIVTNAEATTGRTVLDKYESSIRRDLERLDTKFQDPAELPHVEIFALDDEMLVRATRLALDGVAAKPFDHAILAGILVRSSKLWASGERRISFCETDSDLQPWDKYGNAKPPLTAAYDEAHVWVYGDFTLAQPPRAENFE